MDVAEGFLDPSIKKNRLKVLQQGVDLIETAQDIWGESIRITADSLCVLNNTYEILKSIQENHGLHLAMLDKQKEQE
jgi:hypothetical protein